MIRPESPFPILVFNSTKKTWRSSVDLENSTWLYTTDELQAVLARVFPMYQSLTQELENKIWLCALTQLTAVDCIYCCDMNQFWAHGSKEPIRECSFDIPKTFKLRPIYITPT
jgi:hypothetical protein